MSDVIDSLHGVSVNVHTQWIKIFQDSPEGLVLHQSFVQDRQPSELENDNLTTSKYSLNKSHTSNLTADSESQN